MSHTLKAHHAPALRSRKLVLLVCLNLPCTDNYGAWVDSVLFQALQGGNFGVNDF